MLKIKYLYKQNYKKRIIQTIASWQVAENRVEIFFNISVSVNQSRIKSINQTLVIAENRIK